MQTRSMAWSAVTAVAIVAAALAASPTATAYIAGDGKGRPARDCLIGLAGYDRSDQSPFGRKATPAIQCVDGDTCDLDGTQNGSCRFSFAIALNWRGVPGCTPRRLVRVKAKAKAAGVATDLGATVSRPLDRSSALGVFVDFPVPLTDFGAAAAEPGRGVLTLLARRPKDRDRFLFVCNPAPPDSDPPGTPDPPGADPPRCPVPPADYAGRWRLDGTTAPGACAEATFPDELVISNWPNGGYTTIIFGLEATGYPDANGLELDGWVGADTCATGAFDVDASIVIRESPADCTLAAEIIYSHSPIFGACPPCNARWTGVVRRVAGPAGAEDHPSVRHLPRQRPGR